MSLLRIKDLVTSFETSSGWVRALDGITFAMEKGRIVGLVGESGSGKTVTAMSILDLLSMAALNPGHRVGKQLVEAVRLHRKVSRREALARVVELLGAVRVPDPVGLLDHFPYELSSGMRQRVSIAMALVCEPELLILDEPTTALDVTVQAQILDMISDLKERLGMAVLLITHDLGVVAQYCDEVVVMYAGRVVEHATARRLFADPKHAYSNALLHSIPRLTTVCKTRFKAIPGHLVPPEKWVAGCRFCQRLNRDKSTLLRKRPEFLEIWQNHRVEVCPECYKG